MGAVPARAGTLRGRVDGVLAVCKGALGARPFVRPIYHAGSIGIGVLMAKLVELPALRLRERWLPAESVPLAPTA